MRSTRRGPRFRSSPRSGTAPSARSSSAAGRVAPTPEQLRELRRETRIGLEAGARMLSFGLVYLPGAYAATDELVAVAEEAAAVGAPLVPTSATRAPASSRPSGR